MNHQEVNDIIRLCAKLWPWTPAQTTMDADMVRGWHLALADIDAHDAAEALIHYNRLPTSQFPPRPGALAQLVLDNRARRDGTAAPDVDQAWAEVWDRVTRIGYERGVGMSWTHPAITACVTSLGWNVICRDDNPMTIRAHFLRIYSPAAARTEGERRESETRGLFQSISAATEGERGQLPP